MNSQYVEMNGERFIEDYSIEAKHHREDLQSRDEVFQGLMMKAIKAKREHPRIGIQKADPNEDPITVRARFASFRFGSRASAVADL